MTEKKEWTEKKLSRLDFVKAAVATGIGLTFLGALQVKEAKAAGAAGQVAYYTAPDTLTGDSDLTWSSGKFAPKRFTEMRVATKFASVQGAIDDLPTS